MTLIALGTEALYIPHREPPEHWQAALDAFAPPGQRTSWLKLVWMAGKPYEPVGRWVLYEMSPALQFVPDHIWLGLKGEDPRTWGHWETDMAVPGGRRWVSKSTVSGLQWDLFRRYHCYPILYWVIQGEHGGHPFRLNPAERHYLQTVHEGRYEHPGPGMLPYADFDNRVLRKLKAADRLRQWDAGHMTTWEDRTASPQKAGETIMAEDHALESYYELKMLDDLDAVIEDYVRALPQATIDAVFDQAHGTFDNRDQEHITQRLTEHTSNAPFGWGSKE
jgi:hypothetical protein